MYSYFNIEAMFKLFTSLFDSNEKQLRKIQPVWSRA